MKDSGLDSSSARIALGLWVLVLVALAYGITNTFINVLDLFAG